MEEHKKPVDEDLRLSLMGGLMSAYHNRYGRELHQAAAHDWAETLVRYPDETPSFLERYIERYQDDRLLYLDTISEGDSSRVMRRRTATLVDQRMRSRLAFIMVYAYGNAYKTCIDRGAVDDWAETILRHPEERPRFTRDYMCGSTPEDWKLFVKNNLR